MGTLDCVNLTALRSAVASCAGRSSTRAAGCDRPVWGGVVTATVLTLLLVGWFGRAATAGWLLVDPSPGADVYMLSTIWQRSSAQVLAGHLPLWFPEFAGGYPLHAAWMYGLLYPPTWLFGALPAASAWTWLGIAHIVFAASGVYALVWEERRDAAAAATGAVVLGLSGFMLGRVVCGHLNLVMPVAWVPWLLLLARRTARGVPRSSAWLGVCAGIALLAGHVQVWFYAAPLVGAYALFEAMQAKALRRALPRLLLAGTIAAGISAIQWVPAMELFVVSGHPPDSRERIAACSVPFSALAAQIAPRCDVRREFAHEFTGLAGPLAVGAALLAVRLRDPRRWFWFGVLGAGVVVSLGVHTLVSEVLNELPPLRFSRAPGRGLLLAVVAGSVLAGHVVADRLRGRRLLVRAAVPAAFAASALAFGPRAPDVVPPDVLSYDWTPRLPAGAREHRVNVKGERFPYVESSGIRTLRNVCPLDTPGYKALTEGLPGPLVAWWFDVGAEIGASWDRGPIDADSLVDLARSADVWRLEPAGGAQLFTHIGEDLPDARVLERLRAGERTLWIQEPTRDIESYRRTWPPTAAATLPVVRRSPSEMDVDVPPDPSGFVLVSEKWYPGWEFRNGDASSPWRAVERGNLAFMAVEVTRPGLRLAYRPRWLWPSLLAGIASLALAAGVRMRRRRRD